MTTFLLVVQCGYLAPLQDAAITIAINESDSVMISATNRLALPRMFTIETSH